MQVTDNTYNDLSPQISDDGNAVWVGHDGHDWEIYFYEIPIGIITRLTENDHNESSPQINLKGDGVWIGHDGHDWEVSHYENSNGRITQLTENEQNESSPQINCDGCDVWQGYDGEDWEIYLVCDREVTIDIRPGTSPNNINLGSRGVVPVAVLSTPEFDAGTVSPVSVIFAGAPPDKWHVADVDGDADQDLLVHFRTQLLVDLNQTSIEAVLTGETFEGSSFSGRDAVRIVPPRRE
jgi:hypothetical protein